MTFLTDERCQAPGGVHSWRSAFQQTQLTHLQWHLQVPGELGQCSLLRSALPLLPRLTLMCAGRIRLICRGMRWVMVSPAQQLQVLLSSFAMKVHKGRCDLQPHKPLQPLTWCRWAALVRRLGRCRLLLFLLNLWLRFRTSLPQRRQLRGRWRLDCVLHAAAFSGLVLAKPCSICWAAAGLGVRAGVGDRQLAFGRPVCASACTGSAARHDRTRICGCLGRLCTRAACRLWQLRCGCCGLSSSGSGSGLGGLVPEVRCRDAQQPSRRRSRQAELRVDRKAPGGDLVLQRMRGRQCRAVPAHVRQDDSGCHPSLQCNMHVSRPFGLLSLCHQ